MGTLMLAETASTSIGSTESEFDERYPAYAATRHIDLLRDTEYRRFDEQQHTYLDYTGGSVYADSQLRGHMELLAGGVFGNPHSGNPASKLMTQLAEQARCAVLRFFQASRDEYEVVFTNNATGALKLIAESYPFSCASQLLLTVDNHNSVNGIREFARRAGADVAYAPILPPELRLDACALERLLERPTFGERLFAYPAQSNFSGVQHPLDWIEAAQRRGWDVLLDASAFVPTNQLDLSRWRPEYVTISFYKIFGYPTGMGALIVRKEALRKLRRPWFAGGTITFSSVCAAADDGNGYYLTPGSAGFEDGTVNYLSLPAVEIGLRWMSSIGVDAIHERVMSLTGWLLEQLQRLRHANGRPLVQVYGPRDTAERGANVALNFLDPDGRLWDCWQVERLANERNLSLRAGCHCNPGAREVALHYTREQLAPCFQHKSSVSYADFLDTIKDRVGGVVRVSMGVASTLRDVEQFLAFARSFADVHSA